MGKYRPGSEWQGGHPAGHGPRPTAESDGRRLHRRDLVSGLVEEPHADHAFVQLRGLERDVELDAGPVRGWFAHLDADQPCAAGPPALHPSGGEHPPDASLGRRLRVLVAALHRRAVSGQDLRRGAGGDHAAVVQPDRLLGHAADESEVVRHEDERAPARPVVLEPPHALALERGVADREHLVDQQDVDVERRDRRERDPCDHPCGEPLEGRVREILDLGEVHDPIDPRAHVLAAVSLDRPEEVHVLAAGEVGMEPDEDVDQRRDPAGDVDRSSRRRRDACDQLQHRGLAGAVVSHDRDGGTWGCRERDIVQRVERVLRPPLREGPRHQPIDRRGQCLPDPRTSDADPVGLRESLELECVRLR